jgi:hypothetical protein
MDQGEINISSSVGKKQGHVARTCIQTRRTLLYANSTFHIFNNARNVSNQCSTIT